MPTKTGHTYLFACHMLASVLQLYYEFLTHNEYSGWHDEYEVSMGWLLEEIAFTTTNEQVDQETAITLQTQGEEVGDIAYLTLVRHLTGISDLTVNKITVDHITFLRYCATILKILNQFHTMLTSKEMATTEYFQHYQKNTNIFNTLKTAINQSIQSKQNSLDEKAVLEMEKFASDVSNSWMNQLTQLT